MASSAAANVEDYLAELPPERSDVMAKVRGVIRKHLPKGYVETMNWGMIAYEVPLSRYPDTYNGQPLAYVALAAQKNNYSLYLNCAYSDKAREADVRRAFADAGKKVDMGKSCVRFRKLDDLPLPAIGRIVASTPVDEFIKRYEAARQK
jgi:hypothetical protein